MMIRLQLAASALLLAAAVQAQPAAAGATPMPADPVLAELLRESLAQRPELRQADALVKAERERVPQAGGFQDPILTLGIQNDGFNGLQIGKMDTSYWQVMVTQPLPWPGKLGLREEVASSGVRLAEASAARARLSAEADVRRAYLDLLLVRDRPGAARQARGALDQGRGAGADPLRDRRGCPVGHPARPARAEPPPPAALGPRGRGADPGPGRQPAPRPSARRAAGQTTAPVRALSLPDAAQPCEVALADAEQRSPELLAGPPPGRARRPAGGAGAARALPRPGRDRRHHAARQPRAHVGGWHLDDAADLLRTRSSRGRWPRASPARPPARDGAEAVLQVLRLRVQERQAQLANLLESAQLYRDGLIVQSQATADST